MANQENPTLTLNNLPAEFIRMCEYDGVSPENVIKGFIGDLVGIERGEYFTNGSDERMLADDYYARRWMRP